MKIVYHHQKLPKYKKRESLRRRRSHKPTMTLRKGISRIGKQQNAQKAIRVKELGLLFERMDIRGNKAHQLSECLQASFDLPDLKIEILTDIKMKLVYRVPLVSLLPGYLRRHSINFVIASCKIILSEKNADLLIKSFESELV